MALLDRLTWLGHAGFRIEWEGRQYYLDPFHVAGKRLPPADAIFITHPHYDHWSPDEVKALLTPETILVAPRECRGRIEHEILTVEPGKSHGVGPFTVTAVPAYNSGKPFHPRDKNWVGYVIDFAGERLYHAGDTDAIPEMRDVETDIALLPVGGTYTMTAEEAAAAATAMKAAVVAPMHYGSIVGSAEDAETFRRLVQGKRVHVFPFVTA